MWEQVLLTDQLHIQMNTRHQVLELTLNHSQKPASTIRINHSELTLLLHTLLEVNRQFRGD
ncbi:hypothetical protein LOZ80_20055 [Paenibacillus sp. HWE-109]|uniref:hypothetical protein n=1 Tax=Paenibacillus sp. HWE-109 TaxID=1306526 RepID=UPI001EDF2DC4|nr:hypothetical protein [Paenibacillus sp. HWE-109]UKS23939.1 hypothetical protein LOZ80_20055 [Paenibacillus sp. HWE-109]